MRLKAVAENNISITQAWAGQAASLAKEFDADELIQSIWVEAVAKIWVIRKYRLLPLKLLLGVDP